MGTPKALINMGWDEYPDALGQESKEEQRAQSFLSIGCVVDTQTNKL